VKRRDALTAAALIAARPAPAQDGAATPRKVGVLSVGPPRDALRAAFTDRMRELGWVEGRNVDYQFANAAGEDGLPVLAASMVAAGPDVIVASSAVSIRALQKATSRTPIVMIYVVDPVGNGFAESLARPGGNITGLSNQQQDLIGKWLELLRLLVPQARRVAFLINGNNPASATYRSVAQQACTAAGLTCVLLTASTPVEVTQAAEQLAARAVQGLVVPADPFYSSQSRRMTELLQPTRVPVVYGQRLHVDHGGLLSYGTNIGANYRLAASYVDRILKGAAPATLPIEQPTRFELVVNLRTARAIGLAVPNELLLRADVVIE
jgi:putative ABC transport system substrate-binding protein